MMEDNCDVPTPLEDGYGRASPVDDVSEQLCLGEDRSVNLVRGRSATGRLIPAQGVLEQLLQDTTDRVSSRGILVGSRRVSPSTSLAESLQSVGMAEELTFQLEMKRMEIETEVKRLAAEERRKARRLEIEAASEAKRLEAEREAREAEERREDKRLELEARRLEVEKEEAEKNRDFDLERSRIGANSTHKGGGGEGNSVER